DRKRSLEDHDAARIVCPDASFVSLQYPPAQLPRAQSPLHDLGSRIRDWEDTCAIIDGLDLVISVDTAVAHLAGAMGKPVWTLLAFCPDWRWGLDAQVTAWYPTMRLFRQRIRGDWGEVVARIRA